MKGMTTCKVCGRDFALIAEEHYVAQDPQKVGAIANLVSTDRASKFDAFDCPHCGCQNVMQSRKPVLIEESEGPCDYGICDECGECDEQKDHDGCLNCKYEDMKPDDLPCATCKMRYKDNWEEKQ